MARVADEHDRVAAFRVAARLRVHLRHERAGRIDRREPARLGGVADGRRDTVRGEDDCRAARDFLDRVDEDCAALLELPHDVRVVDDLLAHIHGRPVEGKGALDRFDGSLDAGAIAARRGQKDALHQGAARIAVAGEGDVRSSGNEKARRSGGSLRRALPSCSPRGYKARYTRRGSHRPVTGTL